MRTTNRHIAPSAVLASLWLAATVPSCTLWEVPEEDAGEAAFAAEAIHAILGRPPKGTDEVQAIVQLLDDRGEVAAVIAEQPEFVDYWAQVLLDDLGVDRMWTDAGAKALATTCYGAPMLSPTLYEKLVAHLSSANPTAPFCYEVVKEKPVPNGLAPAQQGSAGKAVQPPTEGTPLPGGGGGPPPGKGPIQAGGQNVVIKCADFNMVDVARAAVTTDRLDVLYLAYLGPLAALPFDNNMESNRGDRFWEFYLDRDPTCLECHSTTYSTTDPRPSGGNWDRTYPVGEYMGDAYADRYGIDVGYGPMTGLWSHGHRFTIYDVEGAALSVTNDTGGFTWRTAIDDTGTSTVEGRMPRYGGHWQPPTAAAIKVDSIFTDHAGTVRPWGMHASCFPTASGTTYVAGGITASTGGTAPGRFALGIDGSDNPTHVMPLMRALQRGLATSRAQAWDVPTYQPEWDYGTLSDDQKADAANSVGWVTVGAGKGGSERVILGEGSPLGYRCFDCHPNPGVTCTCHGGQQCDPTQCPGKKAPDLAEVLPKMSATKLATILKDGSGEMPPVCPDYECGRLVAAYVATEPIVVDWTGDGEQLDRHHVIGFDEHDKEDGRPYTFPHSHRKFPSDRSVAMAHLVAMTAADHVFEEVFGSRLTIEHGFPRTPEQADVLYEATSVLQSSGWSLRSLLSFYVQSPLLNRAGPYDPADDATLALIANPWVASEPTGAGGVPQKYWPTGGNGSGDVVHKRSAVAILHGIHEALGWPAPRVYSATDTTFPGTPDQVRMGRFLTLLDPGQTSVQLREYVYYEQLVGQCAKPAGTSVDWIDKLVDAAAAHPTTDVSDVLIAVKDRLITDPSLETGEADDVVTYVNTLALVGGPLAADDATSGVPEADLELTARTMCGVILRSPDFLLGGLRPNPDSLAATPRLRVRLPGEPGGPFGWCSEYEGIAEDLGLDVVGACHPGGGPPDEVEESPL